MEFICETNKCTGCMACMAICKHHAIIQSQDRMGFRIPHIIIDKCIDCNLCKKICPANITPPRYPSLECFAAVSNDNKLLNNVASGGIASLITINFIKEGGIVYGCSGENIKYVSHTRITNVSDVYKLQGSKYVQSNISHIYHSIQNDLKKGSKVLFIGVSCQVAGIKKFLIKEYDNFYTIDLICHGASSQKILNEDLDYYKTKYKLSKITNVRFRNKEISQSGRLRVDYGLFFNAEHKKYSFKGIKDPFMLSYFNNQLFRDSCYSCGYTTLNRVSDLTIGDFWGLSDDAGLSDKLGVSVCINHTDKGEYLLNLIKKEAILVSRDLKEAISGNPQLVKPTAAPVTLDKFRNLYAQRGLVTAARAVNRKQLVKSKIYHWVDISGMLSIVHFIRKLCRI